MLGSPAKSVMSLSLTQSLADSPPCAIKHKYNIISDSDDGEVFEVHIAKAQKISTNAGHPKVVDYDLEDATREVILSAANTYCTQYCEDSE